MEKASYYNIYVEYDKNYLIFNILSETLLKCDKRMFEWLRDRQINSGFISENKKDKLLAWGFLVSGSKQEIQEAILKKNREIYGDRDFFVMILPTNACNFNCVYCPQVSKEYYMTKNVCDSIIHFICMRAIDSQNIQIDWFGGEPLLCKDIIYYFMDRLKYEVKKELKKPIIASITTNGYLLDYDTFENLRKLNVLYYQITIDGTEKRHNMTRPLRNGEGTYERIIDNLRVIKERNKSCNFRIVIRVNIDNTFGEEEDEFLKVCKEIFSHDNRFQFYPKLITNLGGDKIKKIQKRLISSQQYLKDVKRHWNDEGLILYNDLSSNDICYSSKKKSYVFDYNGEIYKCNTIMTDDNASAYVKNENHIGWVKERRFFLDESKISRWIQREPYLGKCQKCILFPVCLGGRCTYAYHYKSPYEIEQCVKKFEEYEGNIVNLYQQGKYIELENT